MTSTQEQRNKPERADSLVDHHPSQNQIIALPSGATDAVLIYQLRSLLNKGNMKVTWIERPPSGHEILPLLAHPHTTGLLVESRTGEDGILVVDQVRHRQGLLNSEFQLGFRQQYLGLLPWNKAFSYRIKGEPRIGYIELLDLAPTYQAEIKDSPLHIDTVFYDNLAAYNSDKDRKLLESITVPIREARAWKVPKGHICRLIAPEGRQVADLNIWNANDTRERFWASRTRQLHGTHVTTHARLWSTLPFMRPLVTIIADTLGNYGIDKDGGRVHDLLGTRCDPYIRKTLSGEDFDHHCHSNLVRAVTPLGLTEFDVHDVINVFQVTGLNKDGRYFMGTCPAKPGDYFEFFAEIDVLCAMSACPGGDLSVFNWSDDEAMLKTCHPLGVEVYRVTNESLLQGWKSPHPPPYKGNHGMPKQE